MSAVQTSKIALLYGVLSLVSAPAFAGPAWLLKSSNHAAYNEALNGFRKVYPSGIEVDYGKAQELLTRSQADPPSVIVAIGSTAAETAHEKLPAIPLVFMMVPDPLRSGLTGANVAGISMEVPGDVQLAGFAELLPGLKKRVAIVYNPARSSALVAQAKAEADRRGLFLELVPAESSEQVRLRYTFIKPLVGAIWIVPDESFIANDRKLTWFKSLANEATAVHVPLFLSINTFSTLLDQEGALAALVADPSGMGEQCGELVKEVESGKIKFETIGLKSPGAFGWEVNPSTADKIGLKIPENLLKSAKLYPKR
ncbi:MAG: ABC transporter substrate-binding protein [Candidatus Dormibacteraceae bacterium]